MSMAAPDPLALKPQENSASASASATATASIKICDKKSIKVSFNDGITSTYHASWLWHNRTSNVQMPSGQMKESPGSWTIGTSIEDATIRPCANTSVDVGAGVGAPSSRSPDPNKILFSSSSSTCSSMCSSNPISDDGNRDIGYTHMLGFNGNKLREIKLTELELAITWNRQIHDDDDDDDEAGNNDQDEAQSQSPCEPHVNVTTYNLAWLKQWACDNASNEMSRLKREISEKHTFLHKYRNAKKHLTSIDLCVVGTRDMNMNLDAEVTIDTSTSKKIPVGIDTDTDMDLYFDRRDKYQGLACVDYHGVVTANASASVSGKDETELLALRDLIFLDGAAIVDNAPCVSTVQSPEEIVTGLGNAIGGKVSHGGLYGTVFHVMASPVDVAINAAFTSVELCPHQDLAYYESKPGFQLLHCASMPTDIVGGESILIDCMAAANHFRDIAPNLFETLVRCPATFQKVRAGACMTYFRPHIVLHNDGYEEDLNSMDREIVSVHWAPPFEGPLRIKSDRVEDYFKAYAAFELMLDNTKCPRACSVATGIDLDLAMSLNEYARKNTWTHLLQPGETIVFNNTRMLHGRRSFEMDSQGSSKRHLMGTYTNIDDSLNLYRTMLREMGLQSERIIPNVGNGTTSM